MALNANLKKIGKSFIYAGQGIIHAIKHEINLRIHVLISVLVVLLGLWLPLSVIEWLIIILAIGGMISLELLNTALERVVDLATSDYHPLAKQAKDTAAGAVLIFAVTSVILGVIIFLPKLIKLF